MEARESRTDSLNRLPAFHHSSRARITSDKPRGEGASQRTHSRPIKAAATMATNLSRVQIKWLLSLSLSSHVKNPKR
jgi:hypothetical protein